MAKKPQVLPPGVREKRPGYYEVRAYAGYDPVTKRPKEVSRGVRGSLNDAKRVLRKLQQEVESRGDGALAGDVTLQALFDRVLGHLRSLGRSETTIVGYTDHMHAFVDGLQRIVVDEHGKYVRLQGFDGCDCAGRCSCAFERHVVVLGLGSVRLSKLSPTRIQDFYNGLAAAGVSGATITRYHATLRRSLNLAMKWGLLGANPATRTERKPVVRKQVKRPADAEVAELVGAAFEEDWDLGVAFQLACASGGRRGEVIASRWRNVVGNVLSIEDAARQARGLSVTVDNGTKTHAERDVQLDEFTLGLLREHRTRLEERAATWDMVLTPDAFILSDAADGSEPWRPNRLTRAVGRLRTRTSFSGRLQDLRGWSLASAFDDGADLADVVRRGGWGNAATFLTYYLRSAGKADKEIATSIGDRLAAARALRDHQHAIGDELAERRERRAT